MYFGPAHDPHRHLAAEPALVLGGHQRSIWPVFFLARFSSSAAQAATVRAAALGRVEVSGRAVGPYTLVAPLSHADCLYYRLAIESNPQGDLRKRIQELCAPLFLDDGTGTLMIYPQGSELLLQPSSERSEYGKLALA
ncbi:MAG: hypothetical protein WBV26_21810, partial [Candidatus Sulfotelmatobacter sp.]